MSAEDEASVYDEDDDEDDDDDEVDETLETGVYHELLVCLVFFAKFVCTREVSPLSLRYLRQHSLLQLPPPVPCSEVERLYS